MRSSPDRPPANAIASVSATRCGANPLVTFGSSPSLGGNINGPSVIRAPAWLPEPLGRYYMYFGNHGGGHIRLAFADALSGPWRVHEPGALRLEEAGAFRGHIASPDVHIDNERRTIRMYFHGSVKSRPGQWSGVATSRDGVRFGASGAILGRFYFRVFRWRGHHYAVAKNGNEPRGELSRSADGLAPFEGGRPFLHMVRHTAVMLRGDRLIVFYSRKGDAPERILASTVDLSPDWTEWEPSEPVEVIAPEADYEGVGYPNEPSEYGGAVEVRQLRDPCVFEEDGRTYLFYSIAGEMGIAMAELEIRMKDGPGA
ncbi:MAG: hypothetical protein ACYS9X_04525 [Planctomycetota bacterium]